MKRITLEDEGWINEIATIHEHLISENELDYQVTSTSIALRYEMIISRLKYADDHILINEYVGSLKGFIWGHYEPQLKIVQIEVLYVKPDFRRQGIATHLKRDIEQWANLLGAISIESTVNKDNSDMINQNKVLGYQTSHLKMSKNLKGKNE